MNMDKNLEIFTTADGSPTLIFRRDDGYLEKMHHSGGAFTESVYIYHYGLTKALDAGLPAKVISVGLGLAYNELLALGEFAKRNIEGQIWSFEALPVLKDQFRLWTTDNADAEYTKIMDEICTRIEDHCGVDALKSRANRALQSGRLQLRGLFPADSKGICDAGVVFYDAFSNKMSPELWQELDLQNSLEPLLAEHTLLCTYAKTGSLKRVLKNLGFQMQDRPGFQGKRDSTLATR